MKEATLRILRCPYCGGRLELVESHPHRQAPDEIIEGILACHCCVFPVVAGIPVLHLQPEAVAAREAIEAGEPDKALRALIAPGDEARARRFEEAARSSTVTYRELVHILGPGFEREYFLHRFSDPSYVVASTVIEAIASRILNGGGLAIDICGGSGHLTRVLLGRSSPPPVIADLYFAKLWLASRFVALGCEPVCCDANAPLPFARGAFRLAMCADAFMFIWTKRQLVSEMTRLTDQPGPSAVVITHTHNALVPSHSHGQALPPAGYRALFETLEPRLFAEAALLDDIVAGRPIDLSRRDGTGALDADPALTIVATRDEGAFQPYSQVLEPERRQGVLRVNPLYEAEPDGSQVRLRLRLPSPDYEEEFGDCRRYLAEEVTLDRTTLAAVAAGRRSSEVLELLRRRVVLDMPKHYY
ncbi:MAG: hypothetical protein EXR95_07805 [Gemmatimonadetes bacterium]|nr:hypothetical protein [Gemmatimonadota bacterium]